MPGKATARRTRDRGVLAASGVMMWGVLLAACGPPASADRANLPDAQMSVGGAGGRGGSGGGTGGSGGPAGGAGGGVGGSGGTTGGTGGTGGGSGGSGGIVVQGDAGSGGDGGVPPDDAPPLEGPPPDAPVDLPRDLPPLPPDGPPAPPELARGRVGHWKLDEARGNVVHDSSGIGNHGGTVNILPEDWQSGKIGTALVFTPSRRTFAIIASHPTIGPTDAITLSVWVNARSWAGSPRIVQKAEGDTQYGLRAENDRLRFTLRLGAVTAVETTLPPPNRWVHIGTTYDGRLLRIYVDGAPVAMQAGSGAIASPFAPLMVGTGSQSGAETEFFSGLIDDVIIYERALSAAEVKLLSEARSP